LLNGDSFFHGRKVQALETMTQAEFRGALVRDVAVPIAGSPDR